MNDQDWLTLSATKRLNVAVEEIAKSSELYILNDEHGCVMLSSEDEDGIPVWPSASLASLWATEDWSQCEPMAISLKDWSSRWVSGMQQDDLYVIVCPLPGEEGEMIEPEEFAAMLAKQ